MPRTLTSTTKMDRVVGGLNLLVKKNKTNQTNQKPLYSSCGVGMMFEVMEGDPWLPISSTGR